MSQTVLVLLCLPNECSEKASFYSGDIDFETSKPGMMKGTRESTALIGESVQPLGGGRFRPIVQIMDRGTGDGGKTTTELFAAARGPCLFGGCSEFCVDSKFGISIAKPGSTVTEMHELPFGDFASITKQRPRTFQGAMRELFTDSDIYEVTFHSKHITPQQKANVLATMVHLEYMFFERDNDMIYCEGNKLHINLFNLFHLWMRLPL